MHILCFYSTTLTPPLSDVIGMVSEQTLLILRVFSTVINNLSQMNGRTFSSCLTVIYIIQHTHFYLTKNMGVLPLITMKPFTNS